MLFVKTGPTCWNDWPLTSNVLSSTVGRGGTAVVVSSEPDVVLGSLVLVGSENRFPMFDVEIFSGLESVFVCVWSCV